MKYRVLKVLNVQRWNKRGFWEHVTMWCPEVKLFPFGWLGLTTDEYGSADWFPAEQEAWEVCKKHTASNAWVGSWQIANRVFGTIILLIMLSILEWACGFNYGGFAWLKSLMF